MCRPSEVLPRTGATPGPIGIVGLTPAGLPLWARFGALDSQVEEAGDSLRPPRQRPLAAPQVALTRPLASLRSADPGRLRRALLHGSADPSSTRPSLPEVAKLWPNSAAIAQNWHCIVAPRFASVSAAPLPPLCFTPAPAATARFCPKTKTPRHSLDGPLLPSPERRLRRALARGPLHAVPRFRMLFSRYGTIASTRLLADQHAGFVRRVLGGGASVAMSSTLKGSLAA